MLLLEKSELNFELKIDSLDDLWVLSEFITLNDTIFSTTTRKVKIGDDSSKKQVTKIIFVKLKVKKTIFENNILRISGEILNETQFTTIGQSHTLNFNLGDKIKILKSNLLKFEEKLLENSIKSKNSSYFLVLIDKDELIVSEFSNFSYRVLFEKKGLGSKKYYSQQINEELEKFKLIEQYLKKDYSKIILAGPGQYKEKFKKFIIDKLALNILTVPHPDVNSTSIQKLIEKIQKTGILSNALMAKESQLISKLLENINKSTNFSYGKVNSFESVNSGCAQCLLISTKLIEIEKESGDYLKLNELMKNIEQINGELTIINSKNESGKILDGLGSIATINRY